MSQKHFEMKKAYRAEYRNCNNILGSQHWDSAINAIL